MTRDRITSTDANGYDFNHPDYEPPCDLYGDCEPHPDEAHESEAMCIWCGGWRYRDYPDLGNWGTWDEGTEEFLANRQKID